MAFSVTTRAAIRDAMLQTWQSRYQAIGLNLLTVVGSDAYNLADSISVLLESFQQQSEQQTKEPFPDTASSDGVDHHGRVDGLSKRLATPATLTVTITGTALATITFGSSVLVFNGINYGAFTDPTMLTPITSVVLDGSGNASIDATASTAGTSTNLPTGTTLTWSSTPTGANPTATVTALAIEGTDDELSAAYAQRIIARRQNRPASGNRADWESWVGAYEGVIDAYVYPLLQPPGSFPGAGTPDTLGCVTVVPLSAAPGDTTGNRVFGGTQGASLASTIGAYIEGTGGASPTAAATGIQLRPVTMSVDDYSIEACSLTGVLVSLQVTLAAAYASPWAYSAGYTVLVSPAPTTTSFAINGDITAVIAPGGSFKPVMVNVGTSNYRGGYYYVLPTNVTFGSGVTTITVPTLPAAPTVASIMLPGLKNFAQIRAAIFDLFDGLGPGDTSPPSRFPTEDAKGRATLFQSSIVARVVQGLDPVGTLVSGVRGILSCSVLFPSSDVTPDPKTLLTLGTLVVHT